MLEDAGLAVELPFRDEADPGRFADAIRRRKGRIDLVIVGGGDGAMNAAIPGLLETGLPLAVLPLGTANNLARTLGVPSALAEACATAAAGERKRIDVGWVNGRHFLNVAGLGLSTQINRQVPAEFKRRWGVFAFIWYGIKLLRRLRPFHAEVRTGGRSLCTRSMQIIVCNGRHYGSGLTIREDAGIDDRRLDLCAVEPARWYQALPLARAMRHGQFRSRHPVLLLSGPEFEIRTRHPMVIDTDGEVTTRTPALFRVLPAALTVLVPRSAKQAAA